MSASVVSLANLLRPSKTQTGVPGPWTSQELAELYRIAEILGRAGMPVEMDSGLSDENEPWFVFFSPDTGDVIAHFARISGTYTAVSSASPHLLHDTCFRGLIEKIVDDQPLVLPSKPSGNVTRLFLHPTTVLAAFVATALVHSRKAIAMADTSEDGGRRTANSEGNTAAGSAAASILASPGAGGQVHTTTVASVATLISYIMSMDKTAAETTNLDSIATLANSISDLEFVSENSAAQANQNTSASTDVVLVSAVDDQIRFTHMQSKETAWVLNVTDSAKTDNVTLEPFRPVKDASVVIDHAEGSTGPSLSLIASLTNGHSLGTAETSQQKATPAQTAETPVNNTKVETSAPAVEEKAPEDSKVVLEFSQENLKAVTSDGATLVHLIPEFQLSEDVKTEEEVDPSDQIDGEAPGQTPNLPDDNTTLILVDGSEEISLGEGKQMIHFQGGEAVVDGFVFGEDILLLSPEMAEMPLHSYFVPEENIAVLNFTDGSSITLTGVSFLSSNIDLV